MIKPENKAQLLLALKKVRGGIKNVESMIEEERYCLDIVQQINAALGTLRNTNIAILKNHLQTCGGEKLVSKDEGVRNEFIEELIQTFTITSRK